MKPFYLTIILLIVSATTIFSQVHHNISGSVGDSLQTNISGATVKLISVRNDTSVTITDSAGNFQFSAIRTRHITVTFYAIGYQGLIRHYDIDTGTVSIGRIILTPETHLLNEVTVVSVKPIIFKEDTVEYRTSAYKVRDNAPIEDVIRKLPGVDVDQNGNITAQGKAVTKVRVNGKDFFNGDVQSATRNLPADIVENIQIIDDYGDQANLTGVKTGDPTKIMNITIKSNMNHGYTAQGTVGGGSDALPKQAGIENDGRYLALLNAFTFNGDQQIAFLGNVNNTNVNTFSFGTPSGPPSQGGAIVAKKLAAESLLNGASKISIGSGGSGNFTSQSSIVNGITDTHAFGTNFRDQWGKHLSVYGSYSFSDNTVVTNTTTLQQNTTLLNPGSTSQVSNETDKNINHRIQWNMEYKPDAVNYLKIVPSFSYATSDGAQSMQTTVSRNNAVNAAYNSVTANTLITPGYGLDILYNHRFKKQGRNISVDMIYNSNENKSYQNPVYNFTAGVPTVPLDQQIHANSHTNSAGTKISYLEPLNQFSFLEFNYNFNRSKTDNNKETDSLNVLTNAVHHDSTLSNQYNYTFTTNRFGLNYRYVNKNTYNYTIGFAVQPTVLDGNLPTTGQQIRKSVFNIIPTAHLVYNISKNQVFSFNYSGSSDQPSFLQLQPVTDFSNATYPVQGNPDLAPSFSNRLSVLYNRFNFESGKTLFANVSFTQTSNQVVTNTIIYPTLYRPSPALGNTYFTKYLNADGYYSATGFVSYAVPWHKKKYTLLLNSNISYTNNIGYVTNVDSLTYFQTTEKNIARNLVITPGLRLRADFTDIIDAQFLTSYSINRTFNSIQNNLTNSNANVRAWNIALSGKNYFKDWTMSYDYSKVFNYGYAESVHATNPNLLNMYVERRFLKGHRATIRLAAFDIFNQNTGFSTTTSASAVTQTSVNRLGRYYLMSFTLRLQKFAGK